MKLQQTFYNLINADRSKIVSEDFNIKSVTEFHAILAKERARVDRNSHVFSVVSFEVGLSDTQMESTCYLVEQLKKHIRITDEIGWLDNHSIGVLLFNSTGKEAKHFIEKIKPNSPQKIKYKYSISSYPEGVEVHPHNNETIQVVYRNSCQQTNEKKIAISLQPFFFDSFSARKRLLDIVVSCIAIVVLSPFMAFIAIAIKFNSKGPVLFKQQRAGLGGEPFTFLKFRTMQIDAEEKKTELLKYNERNGPVFKMGNDPRVTRLGKFLRKWSLDELPQFFNVLRGEMSLVGPRPPTMDEVEKYESWHNYRLEVKPGITCIWQVCARHEKSFENWVRLDIEYRHKKSLLFDMKLLALTIPAVLSRRGAS